MARLGRVAIVGGGIAGLATALALRQSGVETAVYERAPELREVGAGIALWPNASRALSSLDVLDTIRERRVLGGPSRSRSSGPTGASCAGSRRPGPRRAVALRPPPPPARRAGGRARAQRGCRVGGGVDGDRPRRRRRNPDLRRRRPPAGRLARPAVGADGLRSAVRDTAVGRVEPTYRGYTVWRAVGPASDWPAADACEVWGRGTRFGLFRLGGGEVYWYVCASRPAGEWAPDERAIEPPWPRWKAGTRRSPRPSGPRRRHQSRGTTSTTGRCGAAARRSGRCSSATTVRTG